MVGPESSAHRQRFDPDLIDWDDPFEVDAGNEPHLFAHAPYGSGDLDDILTNEPALIPAQVELGEADWLLVGTPPGEPPLVVPLATPNSGDARQARPIGIYRATGRLLDTYRSYRGRMGP
jgi:hypothetical protein